jgi:DNA-binding response OmpR family regulator
VLLVEDETLVALAECRALRDHGYIVGRASTGEEAVSMFGDGDYGLVLMDIDLGSGIDGVEAARRILGERTVPIIFVSSHQQGEVEALADGIGSYSYVPKEADQSILLEAVELSLQPQLR